MAQRDKTGGQGRQRQLALNLGLPGWPTFKHTPRKPFSNARPARPDELRPAIPDGPPPSLQLQSQALSASSGTINVFYSDPLPASSPYRDGGRVHAIHLANLLGHFPGYQIVVKRISEYRAGDASASVRTFYIGTVFDEVMPASFLDETAQGAPVTWINYNIWQLGEKLPTRLGLQYVESIFATGGEEKTTYNKIEYKGYTYDKYIAPMAMIKVQANAGVNVVATAKNAAGQAIPYIANSGKFWYVADDPFSYIHPTDRYVAFADTLFSMLESQESCTPRAILRIEDLIAEDDPSGLRNILDVLVKEKVTKFGMTVIPQNVVPQADGTFSNYNWNRNVAMLKQVYRGIDLGGRVMQHGYTHQFTPLRNMSGHSGDDWEFWYKAQETPIPNLTASGAVKRIQDGRKLLLKLGIQQYGWTTPHYEAHTPFYTPFNQVYPQALERRIYVGDDVRAGQFFPYAVRDTYGTKVIPENLGNIQVGWMPAQILEAAKANRNLTCPTASFFIHTYLFEPDYTDEDKTTQEELAALIRGIRDLGFEFVDPLELQVP
ncbi:DUF2334 domain-containing protein [Deinococcus peraridilitoris]|uniref:DUF2334 domain-containing protein n=1 Tax=Deinococcus peraridilitoris TaxID=432329 RepID=UPI0002F51D9E|nr:DUF2334 domain-containing protein [Deinococcus peraridilitoris]